jgi:hypothetical protein
MVKEHYEQLLKVSAQGFGALLADTDALTAFTAAHNSAEPIEKLQLLLADRPEAEMYKLAILEFHFALLAAGSCQYRHANGSLRLFLELALNAVFFSAHEIDLRLWKKGQIDLNWARLTSADDGMFSKRFLKAFNPAIDGEGAQYLTMARTLYRELSEQVHGNASSYTDAASGMQYNKDRVLKFAESADTARLLVEFSVLTRFLPYASNETLAAVETIALADFGHLHAVQAIYKV